MREKSELKEMTKACARLNRGLGDDMAAMKYRRHGATSSEMTPSQLLAYITTMNRLCLVRKEARLAARLVHLAYGHVKGVPYARIEKSRPVERSLWLVGSLVRGVAQAAQVEEAAVREWLSA